MYLSLINKFRLMVVSSVLLFSLFMFLYFPQRERKLLMESYNQEVLKTAQTVALGVKIALSEQNYQGMQMAMNYAKSDSRLAFIALIQVDTVWSEGHINYELKKNIFSLSPENYPLDLAKPVSEDLIVKNAAFTSSLLQGQIMVGFTKKAIIKSIRSIWWASFFMSLIGFVFGSLIGLWLLRSIVRPVLKLKEATQQVGKGERNISVKVKSKDEIGQLANSFNDMVGQLATAENKILSQKELIEKKNMNIMESYHYASRIQSAIIPTERTLKEHFPDSFIFYKPKDIVSGDFPWLVSKDGHIYLAAVDCTGHGVPGALISFIGYFSLEQVFNGRTNNAGEILDLLHHKVKTVLHQDRADFQTNDGMDIALCKINLEKQEVDFAGAHRPLYGVVNGEFMEIKGERRPIGGTHHKLQKKFNNNKIQLQKGDTLFIGTDGLVDQLGGLTGREKFLSWQLTELLRKNSHLSMNEINLLIQKEFEKWKGNNQQTDDVLLVGIRI